MKLAVSLLVVVLGVLALNGFLVFMRYRRRELASVLPRGAKARRQARDLPSRVFVDKDVAGGPTAKGINRGSAHIVLTEDNFFVATWQGRVLELSSEAPGDARCAGPRRLVVEGDHPSRRARVRAEILVDDAEDWAEALASFRSPGTRGAPVG